MSMLGGIAAGMYGYQMNAYGAGYGMGAPAQGTQGTGEVGKATMNPGEDTHVKVGRKSSPAECKTCKERKYQDGSDEMVSFKSAAHVSPEASASAVMGHEQEHVKNAFSKAAKMNGKVLQASVQLHSAICPECGRSYIAGGETTTQIKYTKEDPYSKAQKAGHAANGAVGGNLDLAG